MKKLFTFLLLVIFNYSYSQSINNSTINQEIDSVKKLVYTTDNQKIKLKNLIELCYKYYNDFYDSDSLLKYTRIGIDISIKSKQDSFLIRFYNYTAANYNDYGVYDKALEVNIDILKIDIEGGELKCLHGLDLQKYTPKLILLENITNDIKITNYLKKFGYILHHQNSYNQFYIKTSE